jgi:2-keto-4-pentenoate hydratase/2-oxohepta-3-ene-1,7-dioic acid hydratase in catechol pathway
LNLKHRNAVDILIENRTHFNPQIREEPVRVLTYQRGKDRRAGLLVEDSVYDVEASSAYFGMERLPCTLSDLLGTGKDTVLRELNERIKAGRDSGDDLPLQCCFGLHEVKLRAPIPRPPKIICLGRNYRDHIEEQGAKAPEKPLLFAKASSAVIGPGDPIVIPAGSTQVDFEGEVALVIGRTVKKPGPEEAQAAIFGYTCLNDVTDREAQFGDKQWFRGKSMDTFAPMGPWIVTSDEIGDPLDMNLTTKVNSKVMQSESTGRLIFPPAEIIVFAGRTMTLESGDVISTGTPGGVGVFRDPQVFLEDGDVVEITVDKIGTLSNTVRSAG